MIEHFFNPSPAGARARVQALLLLMAAAAAACTSALAPGSDSITACDDGGCPRGRSCEEGVCRASADAGGSDAGATDAEGRDASVLDADSRPDSLPRRDAEPPTDPIDSGAAAEPRPPLAAAAAADSGAAACGVAGDACAPAADAGADAGASEAGADAAAPACAGSNPICRPGAEDVAEQPCGPCNTGRQTRTRRCQPDTCTWGPWSSPTECRDVTAECTMGERMTVACPTCGEQQLTCSPSCTWDRGPCTWCEDCSQTVYCDTPNDVAPNRGTWCRQSGCSRKQAEDDCLEDVRAVCGNVVEPFFMEYVD